MESNEDSKRIIEYNYDIGGIENNDLTLYEVTGIIKLQSEISEDHNFICCMNSDYDSNIYNWLPDPVAGYEWQQEEDAENWEADYLFNEVLSAEASSLMSETPAETTSPLPDESNTPTADPADTDLAEPEKQEIIPEMTESPDDTGNDN